MPGYSDDNPPPAFSNGEPLRGEWAQIGDEIITGEEFRARLYGTGNTRLTPRPASFETFVGNPTSVAIVQEAIEAATIEQRAIPHTLLFGPPGVGKSTLARLIAQSTGATYLEITASTLETPNDVLRILLDLVAGYERTGKPSILLIDEIHRLGEARGRRAIDQESLYSLLEDWVFHHNVTRTDHGQHTYKWNNPWFHVWPFTCIGATTEPGVLHQALLRRFLIHIEMEPYTEADIGRIILGSAERLGWSITEEAAIYLSRFSRYNPGRSNQLLTQARNRATASRSEWITLEVAEAVIARLNLHPLGLTATDVKVLACLADRPRGIGATELCRAVGISQSQFTGMIEPYLRQLNLIETLSPRVIRPEGLAYLERLAVAPRPG